MEKINKNNNVLRFIELYRNHEVLWNMNLSSYRRNDLKVEAYESISADTKMSVAEVKKKIKSLRTAYRSERSKVERSKKSGCSTDSLYTPTVFWYNDMTFINASPNRRTTVDNSNQEEIGALIETSLESAGFSKTSCTEQTKIGTPTRKRSLDHKSKLDNVLDKLIAINKTASVFETFGKSIARQLNELPEEEAYQLMANIQLLLSTKKVDLLRSTKSKRVSVEILKPIRNFQLSASTHLSESSLSNPSSDVMRSAMSDADIIEEDWLPDQVKSEFISEI